MGSLDIGNDWLLQWYVKLLGKGSCWTPNLAETDAWWASLVPSMNQLTILHFVLNHEGMRARVEPKFQDWRGPEAVRKWKHIRQSAWSKSHVWNFENRFTCHEHHSSFVAINRARRPHQHTNESVQLRLRSPCSKVHQQKKFPRGPSS